MMRFSTQLLLWQLASVIAVVGVTTAVFTGLGVQQLRAEAESTALSIARTVASDSEVRAEVAAFSADPGTPSAGELSGGALEAFAGGVEQSTGALFVVITDDHGIRLAHPDPERLGEVVSTSYADALAGRENVSWESGTLGESARAKVPVFAPDTDTPVGEVSVGFARASVFDDLPPLLWGVGVAAVLALGIGALVALLIRRRLERLTLGVQPEELAALVQNQAAVLEGAGRASSRTPSTVASRWRTPLPEDCSSVTSSSGSASATSSCRPRSFGRWIPTAGTTSPIPSCSAPTSCSSTRVASSVPVAISASSPSSAIALMWCG